MRSSAETASTIRHRPAARPPATKVEIAGFAPEFVSYERGLELQRLAHERVATETDGGTLILLEHTSVYTAGRRSEPGEYPTDGTPVVPVKRGGKVTWHGPGQLVAYPVIRLQTGFGGVNLVHALEEALIAVAADFGVRGYQIAGRTGVWTDTPQSAPSTVPAAKLAQIGIHVSQRIVTHGVALNCSNELAPFAAFVPCGITDAGVTTLSACAGRTILPVDVAASLQRHFRPVLERFAA